MWSCVSFIGIKQNYHVLTQKTTKFTTEHAFVIIIKKATFKLNQFWFIACSW